MSNLSNFIEKRVHRLLERGRLAAQTGDLVTALNEFKAAAFVRRDSDTLTSWGWIEHHLGDTPKAIELCEEAIRLAPDSGGPYNDIGSYLVAMGRSDEAIAWFKRAIASKDYLPRHFPHINLGKVYLGRKEYDKALWQFQEALRYEPDNTEIHEVVRIIKAHLV